jgi:hypothetical protein
MADSTTTPGRKGKRRPSRAETEMRYRARLAELRAVLLEPVYLGSNRPHRTLCQEGHECTTRPSDVLRGWSGCRACVGRDPKVAEAEFHARVQALGGVVLELIWKGVGAPHLVRCSEGHESTPRPSDVKAGGGICRTCARVEPLVGAALP